MHKRVIRELVSTVGVGGALLLLAGACSAQRGSAGYVPQLHRGQEALRAKRWASAASAFREALRWDRNGIDAHIGLGQVYLATAETKRAADEFRVALRLNPHADEAERGLHAATTPGEDEEAFKKLEEQVKNEPDNIDARTTYAEELIERGRLDDAELQADVVLRLSPKEAHAYCALGRVEAKKGNDAEARTNLEMAIKLDSSDDDAFMTLGDLAVKAKDYKRATRYYRRVISIVPDQTEGHRKYADLLLAMGNKKGADHEEEIIKGLALKEKEPPKKAEEDNHPPAVTGGTPTITDTAALNPPGWLEFDPGSLKNLNRDRILGTPFTLKLSDNNRRLQYRLGSDGYIRQGSGGDGYGDTYAGLHYLLTGQEHSGFDTAARATVKIPTARPSLSGTEKFDFYGLLLASRDFTKWGFHGDFNVGLSTLTRPAAPGNDTQLLLAASTTSPIKGGRWQYTNELVYASPILGQHSRFTTMHGFAYAAHRYEVYSLAVQYAMHGDGATVQILVGGSFYLGKLF